MGTKSILVLDGERHWEQRRAVTPTFHADQARAWVRSATSHVTTNIEKLKKGETLHVRRLAHEVTFRSMLDLLFDDQHPGITNLLERIFFVYLLSDYGTWSPWAKFVHSQATLRSVLQAEARRLRRDYLQSSAKPTKGLFGRLLDYQDSQGEVLDDSQIQDHVFTMLIAGVDPSAIATTWTLYWIYRSPHVLQRLRKELIDFDDSSDYVLQRDHYLHAVCQEALRMYPVVTTPSGRKLLKPETIEGHKYPSGVTLLPCTYLAHRREDVFPESEQFLPERFENRVFENWEYFPFGGGRRVCIGARMALIAMKSIVAKFVSTLTMKQATVGAVKPIRHGTLLAPSDNFRLRVAE